MIIFNSIDEINNMPETAVALGTFDGVHLGHQKLIMETVKAAKEEGLSSSVFTFSTHPKNLIKGETVVKNILYKKEKEEIIRALGVDYLVDIPFTREIMELDKEKYVKKLLLDKLNGKIISCGFNHRFGFKAEGDNNSLINLGDKYGFKVLIMPPYMVNDNVVSSSLIRTLIASGRVDRCKEYMGRNYTIKGEVVVGNRLGRKLGFPTSNLLIDLDMVTPPNGVYITYCVYNEKKYPSITNVGIKPTIGDNKKNVETHIFDFDNELYGKIISVEFLQKMRDEVKFDDLKDLSDQIVRDCKEARSYHEKNLDK